MSNRASSTSFLPPKKLGKERDWGWTSRGELSSGNIRASSASHRSQGIRAFRCDCRLIDRLNLCGVDFTLISTAVLTTKTIELSDRLLLLVKTRSNTHPTWRCCMRMNLRVGAIHEAACSREVSSLGAVARAGHPIRDKLRSERSCQAGLSGRLKKE